MNSTETADDKKPNKQSTKNWPELAPVNTPLTPEQVLAEETVRIEGENANKLLIVRSKLLLAVTALSLLLVIQNAVHVTPALLNGQSDLGSLLFAGSAVIHLAAVGYFVMAKDPQATAQLLKLLLILNGLSLIMGLVWFSSLPLTVILILLIFLAYQKMGQLKYGGR